MPRKPVLAVVAVDENEVLFYRWQVVYTETMPRQPLEVTPEQYQSLITTFDRHGFGPAMQQAITWAAAQQLEAICEWLTKQETGTYIHNGKPVGPEPPRVTLLRREFQVGRSEEPTTQDELASALQAVVDHLEASAHNCKQAAQGIREALLAQGRKMP